MKNLYLRDGKFHDIFQERFHDKGYQTYPRILFDYPPIRYWLQLKNEIFNRD